VFFVIFFKYQIHHCCYSLQFHHCSLWWWNIMSFWVHVILIKVSSIVVVKCVFFFILSSALLCASEQIKFELSWMSKKCCVLKWEESWKHLMLSTRSLQLVFAKSQKSRSMHKALLLMFYIFILYTECNTKITRDRDIVAFSFSTTQLLYFSSSIYCLFLFHFAHR
jgi:hypothetical protein